MTRAMYPGPVTPVTAEGARRHGFIAAGVLQAIHYWAEERTEDGWLTMSVADLERLLGLTRQEVRTALDKLELALVIETRVTSTRRPRQFRLTEDCGCAQSIHRRAVVADNPPVVAGNTPLVASNPPAVVAGNPPVGWMQPTEPTPTTYREKEITTPTPSPVRRARPKRADTRVSTALFDEFWRAYPRKTGGKKAAERLFERAVKRDHVEPEVIVEGARRLRDDPNLPEARFIPHPSTWLNQGRWADDPLPSRSGAVVERPTVIDYTRD